MRRRNFLKLSAATAASGLFSAPAITQTSKARTLTFVPQLDLSILDPIWSASAPSTHHGYSVYDTLYGVDDGFRAHPQMAEGHTVSDDQKTWDIKLRPGLKFHDGEPVLARDCVASLKRWSKRDTFGQTLAASVDAFEAADDKTIRIRLKKPFPLLPDALAHPMTVAAFMMPERIANTDPNTQIKEHIGSGPLRFLADEFVQGARASYARNEAYVPRDEAPQGTMGRKQINFDRVEWKIIPDLATSANALQTGEIDWLETAPADLIPLLAKNPNVKMDLYEPLGYLAFMRFNSLIPPFDNPKIRAIVESAINQEDYMRLATGDFPGSWKKCYSFFPCGLPGVKEEDPKYLGPAKDFGKLKADLIAAGYKGEKVVIINAVNYNFQPFGDLTSDLLRKLGMNVELQQMDMGTMQNRRASKAPVEQGGWNIFHIHSVSAVIVNPALHIFMRGSYFGWSTIPEIEALVPQWLEAPSEAKRQEITGQMQRVAFEQAPSIPLGQFYPQTAFRSDISGVLRGSARVMWNVKRG